MDSKSILVRLYVVCDDNEGLYTWADSSKIGE